MRVYTACIGVEKRSTPSRKNGRFSGKNSAKRSFATICAASDSICEKSGFHVASMAMAADGLHLRSTPASPSASPISSGLPRSPSGALACDAVANGAITRCEPCGRLSRPMSFVELQMKQFTSRGSRALKN